jgi:hypothetical protein
VVLIAAKRLLTRRRFVKSPSVPWAISIIHLQKFSIIYEITRVSCE